MAQTQQPMGSSPLAKMQTLGQQGQTMPAGWQNMPQNMPGITQGPMSLGGMAGRFGAPSFPTPQSSTGMQSLGGALENYGTPQQNPQLMDRIRAMQQAPGMQRPANLSTLQGMQRTPPPGAPGQGPGGGKGAAQGMAGLAGNMRQQIGQLPGAPPPGAPARGPGQAKGNPAQNQAMKQQIAGLQGAPR